MKVSRSGYYKWLKNKENLNSKLNQKLREITAQKHRREVLMNSLENNSSLPYSVKNVLNNPKLTGIHGVLGKLLEFEEKYSEALEVSLMSSVSHIVCDNEEDAKEAVRYLKNNNLGRATFLPISVIKPRSIDSESYETIKSMNGFVDIASNLVKYDTKYRNIVLSLLGTIVVVDNIDNANLISKKLKNRYKVVTMTGEVVNIGGSITGGSLKKSSILSERYELENVIKDIDVLDVAHMSRKIIKTGTEETVIEYYYTEITSKNVDKWYAIEYLMDKLNIQRQEVMAIGDNVNDKMMIENAGCGVAMGNSAPYIKESADIVVSNNNEDGVAEVIEQNF